MKRKLPGDKVESIFKAYEAMESGLRAFVPEATTADIVVAVAFLVVRGQRQEADLGASSFPFADLLEYAEGYENIAEFVDMQLASAG